MDLHEEPSTLIQLPSQSSLSMDTKGPTVDSPIQHEVPEHLRKKDGSLSRIRNHAGNTPVLPQTKLCPHCPAKFTRTTHLNRHLRTHTNERLHCCDTCESQFTRSDLLTRHKKSCNNPSGRSRRKACVSCVESKIKCDRQFPCSKCKARGNECIVAPPVRRRNFAAQIVKVPSANTHSSVSPPSETSSASSTTFIQTPESSRSYSSPFQIQRADPSVQIALPSYPSDSSFNENKFLLPSFSTDTNSAFDSLSVSESDQLVPVNSHLSSVYSSDMFEPFFSNLFSNQSSSSTSSMTRVSAWAGMDLDADSPPSSTSDDSGMTPATRAPALSIDSVHTSVMVSDPLSFDPSPPPKPTFGASLLLDGAQSMNAEPTEIELHHYLSLFFSEFSSQIPIVHAPTFKAEKKSPVLLSAMHACGALFVRTRRASRFITSTLNSAREALVQDFAKNLTDSLDQMQLILAVVLLQTIGLFHQQSDQRASSSIYHGMLVMMIRRIGLIAKNANWVPGSLTEVPIETLWFEWARNEMTKRAILWSYMHDCCHCIYFALPSSYHSSEIVLNLPCEDSLWQATTSMEWFIQLQTTSTYGTTSARLTGASMPRCLAAIEETRLLPSPILLNPFANFILIHTVLRRLFITCVEGRLPPSSAMGNANEVNPELHSLQFALHNWLENWLSSPDTPKYTPNSEPLFTRNSLPFYWLGQVALLAYQEGLPPFEYKSPNNYKVEVRFRLVKQWLRHIRAFLKNNDEAPTLFWDELMKLRLQSWQYELENDLCEDQDGVLGFFA